MRPCCVLALLSGSLALAFLLVALSTDNWFVAVGPNHQAHSGLWHPDMDSVKDFIRATQVFTILAALAGLLSISCLIFFITPFLSPSISHRASLLFCVTAFAAGLCSMVGMAIYTGERWKESDPQIHTFFAWSFYMGWASVFLFLCTGLLSLMVYWGAPRPNYDSL
ncbi:protein NKG7 isoform X1 [Gracilinanus agilis]|uniref:protein NKG7 isoform X1 n=1 Tax=Gracilinanus agilis TaxID=191870 RepID=UPI001CFD8BD3|nr:protein NKG7 isoform X1 [Gracilinanus agilis]XP_044526970.1 protein NKG7 isoform X1 [Gracilinanus agilis]